MYSVEITSHRIRLKSQPNPPKMPRLLNIWRRGIILSRYIKTKRANLPHWKIDPTGLVPGRKITPQLGWPAT